MEPNDGELISRGRAGDRQALGQLVERYQGRILAVVIGMVRNREDALELVQETFIRAFRSLNGFRGQSSFYTWIYRIAVNQAIDFKRRAVKRVTVEFDEALPPDAEPLAFGTPRREGDPFERLRNRELGRKVFDAIEDLTPNHRAVIILREVEGLSYEEMSEVLECSMGTVMSRLHYARKKLQSRLSDLI